MANYTILHLHTMLSNAVTNIDSVDSYAKFIAKANECGMKAMAISEHGSVLGWTNKKKEMEKYGMKYIHAEEFYLTETIKEKLKDNFHILLIAKNYDGVLELNKLSSNSFNREDGHFYFRPRITIDELFNTSDNIIISTGCLGGILNNGRKDLQERVLEFLCKNKHRCFLEIQPHQSKDQIEYNKKLYNLSRQYGIELVMTTDTHALDDDSLKARALLQKSKGIHFAEEDEFDLTFKTYKDLLMACERQNAIPMDAYLNAIENTNKIANMVEPFTLTTEYKYPHLWGDNSEKVLREKIQRGIIDRGVDKYPNYQEYLDRIEYEMKAYIHNQAIDFMLLMTDILDWCRDNDIQVGYGRGSVCGSVIAWLLHITEMDSIKHNLNFDRFMNTARVSLSDIDTDFPPSRIEDVKQYIYHKRGLYCSDIVTFNTVAMKGAIRDVCRGLYKKDFGDNEYLTIADYICQNVEQNEEKMRKEYPDVFEYVDLIKGTVVSVGSHPCGCVVSPFSVDDRMGVFTTSTSNYCISQINMKEIDALNYVKLDLLRLDTIEIINKTCKRAGIERVTPDNLDVNDINVWNSMRDDTTQIFQWEGDTGADYIKKLLSDENIKKFQKVDKNVDRMTLLSIGNSAIRPAGASYREDLANGVVRKSGSDVLDDFLKPTFGYLVFQCQIIDFLHKYCGFTMGEADVVRRHFAKKYGTDKDIPIIENGGYLTDKKDHYIKGFIVTMKETYNLDEKESKKVIKNFLQVIEDASNYLFSKNHSQPYSYEGYASAWLRYYYITEFITESLNVNIGNKEKTNALTNYANSHGCTIENPKFGLSSNEYGCDSSKKVIYKGVSSIKDMQSTIGDELYRLSQKKKYNNFLSLLFDIKKKTSCNKTSLDILIKLDYFSDFGDINYLLNVVKYYNKYIDNGNFGKTKRKQFRIADLDDVKKYYPFEKETILKFKTEESKNGNTIYVSEENMYKLIVYLCSKLKKNTTTLYDRITYEATLLGYVSITSSDSPYWTVTSVDVNQYGTPFASLYRVSDGLTGVYKVNRQYYKEYGLNTGDIIYPLFNTKNKSIKKDNKWVQTDETYEELSAWKWSD